MTNLESKNLADRLFPSEPGDDKLDVLEIPPEKRKLHTETYDFAVSTIVDYLSSGHIEIPKFQRRYVWKRPQASRLIESLIIQCPIPVLYFQQNSDEKLVVIDGNQRLNAIRLYIDNEYPLRGLTAYTELEDLYYSQLDPRLQRHILNRTLRCITILKDTHPQIMFDVFERLNTGAVELNPQELRHGIYYGKLLAAIDEMIKNKTWIELTNLRNDSRMRGSELILRFIALANDITNYAKPMKGFLNEFCNKNRNPDDNIMTIWKNDFSNTIESVKHLYGDLAFRVFDILDHKPQALNAALYDAEMIAIFRIGPIIQYIDKQKKEKLHRETAKLFKNGRFFTAISAGTSQKSLVLHRIAEFEKLLKRESIA